MSKETRRAVAITDSSGRVELVDLERAIVIVESNISHAMIRMERLWDEMSAADSFSQAPRTPERYLDIAESAYLNPCRCGSVSVFRCRLESSWWLREATGGPEIPLAAESVDFR